MVHLLVSKSSTHLCRSRLKLIWSDQIRQNKLSVPTVDRQLLSSQNLQILMTSLLGMTLLTNSIHSYARPVLFHDWDFIRTDDHCHIIFARACECLVWLRHLNQRHRLIQSLTKLNNKIQSTKIIINHYLNYKTIIFQSLYWFIYAVYLLLFLGHTVEISCM